MPGSQKHPGPLRIGVVQGKRAPPSGCNPINFTGRKRVCVPVWWPAKPRSWCWDRVGGVRFPADLDFSSVLGIRWRPACATSSCLKNLLQPAELELPAMSAFFVHDLKNTASTARPHVQNLRCLQRPRLPRGCPREFPNRLAHQPPHRAVKPPLPRLGNRPAASELNELVARALAGLADASDVELARIFVLCQKTPSSANKSQVVINLCSTQRNSSPKAAFH